MNELFRAVMGGAEIVACHRGRYFETEEGLRLDVGAFVAGLEYATGRAATIVGKPSVPFFRLAAESLGVPVEEIVMVGDDIDSDVGGAQAAGIRGVLVQTGKYRAETAERSPRAPGCDPRLRRGASRSPRLRGIAQHPPSGSIPASRKRRVRAMSGSPSMAVGSSPRHDSNNVMPSASTR